MIHCVWGFKLAIHNLRTPIKIFSLFVLLYRLLISYHFYNIRGIFFDNPNLWRSTLSWRSLALITFSYWIIWWLKHIFEFCVGLFFRNFSREVKVLRIALFYWLEFFLFYSDNLFFWFLYFLFDLRFLLFLRAFDGLLCQVLKIPFLSLFDRFFVEHLTLGILQRKRAAWIRCLQ
jgi:hypothetical protein